MSKQWYMFAAGLGAICTIVVAMNHELVWTIVGAISVGLNIYNYYNVGE